MSVYSCVFHRLLSWYWGKIEHKIRFFHFRFVLIFLKMMKKITMDFLTREMDVRIFSCARQICKFEWRTFSFSLLWFIWRWFSLCSVHDELWELCSFRWCDCSFSVNSIFVSFNCGKIHVKNHFGIFIQFLNFLLKSKW